MSAITRALLLAALLLCGRPALATFLLGHVGSTPVISAVTLSSTNYASSSSSGTVIGNFTIANGDNSLASLALAGPDAARFQLSSPCDGHSCSLKYSGTNPDGFADGKFLVFITPTLAGARGSGVMYPFTINATVTCNTTIASGTSIATGISGLTAGQIACLADGGTYTISSAVSVSAGIRITGVNAKTTPAITVSGQITGFNVSANGAQIDHVNATGSTTTSNTETCVSFSGFMHDTATLTSFTGTYNQTTNFMCDWWLASTSNVTIKYNLMTGSGYVGFLCDPCNTSTVSNNQSVTPSDVTEPNSYPFVVSSDAVSTAVTFTNNTSINPLWECFDNHGSTDIHWISNYCVGAARKPSGNTQANAGINQPGNGGQTLIRPWANSNFIDLGSAAGTGMNTIVQVAGSGGTMTCGTNVGVNDCEVENNTLLFGALDNSSCGLMATGASGGTLTGTQTVSGNTCSGSPATMAAPTLTTDQPSNKFVSGQANGVIGKIGVVMTPAFPAWVGGWPNYGGWPGTFSIGGTDAAQFAVCVDGQHVCQKAAGTPSGTYNITITGTLAGLNNSPQTSGTITLTGT